MANLRARATAPRKAATERIMLGWISSGQPSAHTMRTLIAMAIWDGMFGGKHLHHQKPQTAIIGGTLITNSRNTLVRQFLDMDDGPEWLLMVDDDQCYPEHMLDGLMACVDQVQRQTGQMCLTMSVPVWRFEGRAIDNVRVISNVFQLNDNEGPNVPLEVPMEELPEHTVIQVPAIGAGCLMVHREALQRVRDIAAEQGIGEDNCWFCQPPGVTLGEDVWFCRMLAACSIPLYVTTTLGVLEHVKEIRLDRAMPAGTVTI
jgi:hypothetical protein